MTSAIVHEKSVTPARRGAKTVADQRAAARRTAWILAGVSVLFLVLFVLNVMRK